MKATNNHLFSRLLYIARKGIMLFLDCELNLEFVKLDLVDG